MSAINMNSIIAEEPKPMIKGIIQSVVEGSQLLGLLNFIKTGGMEYPYGIQATYGGIAFRALNGDYDPSAGIVNPEKEKLGIFGGTIQLDHQMEGTTTHTNAIAAKSKAAGMFFDWAFINGDPTTDPKSFYGLKARILAAQTVYAGDNGDDLSTDLLDELLDKVVGPNPQKVIIMSKYQRRSFKNLLVTAATGATVADVVSHVDSYDGAKIVVMDEDDAPSVVLPQTETRGGSGAVCGSIYCIRIGGAGVEGEYVQGIVRGNMITHKPLAQVGTKIGDLIEFMGGVGVFHGRAAARLAGLK